MKIVAWMGLTLLTVTLIACGKDGDFSHTRSSISSLTPSPIQQSGPAQEAPDPDQIKNQYEIPHDPELEEKRRQAQERLKLELAPKDETKAAYPWIKDAKKILLLEIQMEQDEKDSMPLPPWMFNVYLDPQDGTPLGVSVENNQDSKIFSLADLAQCEGDMEGALVYQHQGKHDLLWLATKNLGYDGGEIKLIYTSSAVWNSQELHMLSLKKLENEWSIEVVLKKDENSREKTPIKNLILSSHSTGLNPAKTKINGSKPLEILSTKYKKPN